MVNSEKHIARWISITAWVVAIILLLIVSIRFLLSTDLAHKLAEESVKKILESELKAEVEIGNIEGDTWEYLIFEDITINSDGIRLSISRVEISYVFIDLFFGDVQIENASIKSLLSELNIDRLSSLQNEIGGESKPESNQKFSIDQIQVLDADFLIKSGTYLPDSVIVISDFTYQGELVFGKDRRIGIRDVGFNIEHGRLPEAISFGFDGSISDNSVSLNDLVFGIGGSVLNGAFNADFNSKELTGGATSDKIDISDFVSGISRNADFDEFEFEIELTGNLDNFEIALSADGPEVQNFELRTGLLWHETPAINSLYLYADYLSSFGLTNLFRIAGGPFEIDVTGMVYGLDESTKLEWIMGLSNLEIDNYHFENVFSEGEIVENESIGSVEILSAGGEQLKASFQIVELFTSDPNWNVEYFVENVNPAAINAEFFEGEIHASGEIAGTFFSFPDSTIEITIRNRDPNTNELLTWTIGEDQIDEVNLSGEISTSKLVAEGYLSVLESEIALEVQAFQPFNRQSEYTYQANFENVNIGNFTIFEGNTTGLTGELYGIGNGRTPDNASIFGTLSLQSGKINNADIDSFDATVQYERGVMKIREGLLRSDIADGVVTGQRDLMDVTNPENHLNLNLEVKNLQPLAGLFGLQALEAKGQLEGIIQQNQEGILIGDFDLNLTDVLVDSIFTAGAIVGTSNTQIESIRTFDANLEIVNPLIQDIVFQDILLQTKGYFTEDSLLAEFDLTVVGSERGRLVQKGTIQKDITRELADIQFTRFDVLSSGSDLVLQKPFNVRVFQTAFGTDTLTLASIHGAFLEFAIPFYDDIEMEAFVRGNSFDLGLIQEIVFGRRFIGGILSGDFSYRQTPGDVLGNGLARIDELIYKGAEADSLILSFDIINERLDARGNIYWDSTLAVTGWANVPFVVNKNELDEEFYNRSIRGNLEVQPTDLSKFELLLEEAGIENTTGIASVNGVMSGQAGTPQFTGVIEIEEPQLSGVPVDRLSAEFNYSNPSKRLVIQSEIFAQNTSVAELNIAYPLDYDFRTFSLYLPGEDDELEIRAVTNNLDIALFNDFFDPNYMASMNGELNADLQFVGPLGNIQPKGFFNLRGGSLTIPYSGIQLENIAMQFDVDNSSLNVTRLYAESGRGRLAATGAANLDGITPTDVLLDVDARLFELINKRDMNLDIDLDATLSGEVERPELIGDLIVNRGFYLLENFGDDALEEVNIVDETRKPFAPFDSLTIDVIVEFKRDFFIRSTNYLDLELEPSGLLDLRKERNDEVELFGVLQADEGYIRPLGKRFDVENGDITFTGSYLDPALDIRSSYIPQTRQKGESVVLYYVIDGTLLNPEFSFESDPQMEQQDIISYVLFNQPFYALDSWQSVFAEENDAQSFQELSDVILNEVETLATRELGVDVVQIDNSGQNGQTAITTGWYLNERTFFSIINELTSSTPKTLFVLEYLLNENWDLILTQGDDARQGVDVRYQFDY